MSDDVSRPRSRFVEVSSELIEILSRDWSRPVQVKIDSEDGDTLRLIFRDVALFSGEPRDRNPPPS